MIPNLLPISGEIVQSAQTRVVACEQCDPNVKIPFDWVIAAVRRWMDCRTDYFMTEAAHCPRCGAEISEKTLVEPASGEWTIESAGFGYLMILKYVLRNSRPKSR